MGVKEVNGGESAFLALGRCGGDPVAGGRGRRASRGRWRTKVVNAGSFPLWFQRAGHCELVGGRRGDRLVAARSAAGSVMGVIGGPVIGGSAASAAGSGAARILVGRSARADELGTRDNSPAHNVLR